MKNHNIVFVKHEPNQTAYLFEAPMEVELKAGEKVFCYTTRGQVIGDCICDSQIVNEDMLHFISVGCGAYIPLKLIMGRAIPKTGYICQDFYFKSIPF